MRKRLPRAPRIGGRSSGTRSRVYSNFNFVGVSVVIVVLILGFILVGYVCLCYCYYYFIGDVVASWWCTSSVETNFNDCVNVKRC
jgi:uncharacterized membrane protein YbhN (UPF0104 family)